MLCWLCNFSLLQTQWDIYANFRMPKCLNSVTCYYNVHDISWIRSIFSYSLKCKGLILTILVYDYGLLLLLKEGSMSKFKDPGQGWPHFTLYSKTKIQPIFNMTCIIFWCCIILKNKVNDVRSMLQFVHSLFIAHPNCRITKKFMCYENKVFMWKNA